MKRIFFLAVCVMAVWSLNAQMTVWSNGQSVYNRSVDRVDSISFGSTTSAGVVEREESGQAVTSFAGKIYLFSSNGSASQYGNGIKFEPRGLAFYSDSQGYLFENSSAFSLNTNKMELFTYTISGDEVVVTTSSGTFPAKIIGSKALVFYKMLSSSMLGDIHAGCYFNYEQ